MTYHQGSQALAALGAAGRAFASARAVEPYPACTATISTLLLSP
jgi:hypothetical protein